MTDQIAGSNNAKPIFFPNRTLFKFIEIFFHPF